MQTPKMHGLLEQPNDVAALPLIIQNNITELINIKLHNLSRSLRLLQNSVNGEVVIVSCSRFDSQPGHLLLLDICSGRSIECSSRTVMLFLLFKSSIIFN